MTMCRVEIMGQIETEVIGHSVMTCEQMQGRAEIMGHQNI